MRFAISSPAAAVTPEFGHPWTHCGHRGRTCEIAHQFLCPADHFLRRIRILRPAQWGGVAKGMIPDPVALGGRPLGDNTAARHTELATHDEEVRPDIATAQHVKHAGGGVRLRPVIEAQGDRRHDAPQRCPETINRLQALSCEELARAAQEPVHPKFAVSPQCVSAGCRRDPHRHPSALGYEHEWPLHRPTRH